MIGVLVLAVIAGGALIAAQGPIYTRMAGMLGGPVQAAVLAFALGAVALLALLAGLGGPRLGVASYMVCVILGQLAASYAYDRVGAFGMAAREFSVANLAGLAMVGAGAVLVIWQ